MKVSVNKFIIEPNYTCSKRFKKALALTIREMRNSRRSPEVDLLCSVECNVTRLSNKTVGFSLPTSTDPKNSKHAARSNRTMNHSCMPRLGMLVEGCKVAQEVGKSEGQT